MLNRREFLIAGSAFAILPMPVMASVPRVPFVEPGDRVDFLYFEDWLRPHQPYTISAFVEFVGSWNGVSYPIVLSYSLYGTVEYWDGVDGEWSMFRKEVPDFSWRDVPKGRYPNIHAFVREKRFGEDPSVMAAQMEHNRLHGVPFTGEPRGKIAVRSTVLP